MGARAGWFGGGMSNPRRANGHRRDQVVKRVKAEEDTCALCDGLVDKTLPHLNPMSAVVDEDIPVARGGSPYDRSNCHLMHRTHNRWKGTMTLAEARAKWFASTGSKVLTTSRAW